MSNIVSVGTNKGGVGKSALAMFSAITSAARGKKTVVVDMDSQCGLSFRIPGATKHLRRGFAKSIVTGREIPLEDFEIGGNLWFVPGDLSAEIHGEKDCDAKKADRFLSLLLDRYDMVIVDSGPRPTELEKKVLSRGDVHFLPAGADKASIVGVIYRMINVIDISERIISRDKFFFIPWGVNTGEKTGKNAKLMNDMSTVMEKFGMSVLPPFAPVQDMTDFICGLDGIDMETFLKYPGIARKRKEILEWSERLWEKACAAMEPSPGFVSGETAGAGD